MHDVRRAIMAVAVAASAAVLPNAALAQETRISPRELPAVVDSAFRAAYPHAVVSGTATEVEDSVRYYEIESLDGKTRRDLLYTADGKVWEVEETVAADSLPPAVKHTVATTFPKARISRAERTTRGPSVQYDLALRHGPRHIELPVDEQGNVLQRRETKAGPKPRAGKQERDRD